MRKKVILTGDRPTGPLHLGHYVGSLLNRLTLQADEVYDPFIIIADVQALTDNYNNPEKVRENVLQVALDYLAVGIDPAKTTIFIQSMIPEIAELTVYFMNFVSMARLMRNPTVKSEIKDKGFGENVTVGFAAYPVSQAGDITFIKGELVPVGEDQRPMIEQTREIVRSFNDTYGYVFPEPEGLYGEMARLPGIYGGGKMGKSANNAIFLSDPEDTLYQKVMSMYTDPEHTRVEDPGKIEGNIVFTYLDVFDEDKAGVAALKEHYVAGGLGDVKLKKRLFEVLNNLLLPIRSERLRLAGDSSEVMAILQRGTEATRERAQITMAEVRRAMKLDYFR